MELKQYINIIFKRLWIVVLLPFAAVSISAYVNYYVLTPVYESNTTLYVINKQTEQQSAVAYNDIMVGQMLVKDYRELIKSRTVTTEVISSLNLTDMSPDRLAGKVSVNSKNDTRIIEIKVQDKLPYRARDIAFMLADVFKNKVVELMKVENVSVVDTAQLPVSPVKPNRFLNILISLFVSMLAAVGIVFLIEYFDDTIKTVEDVEKHLGLTVLGTIPVLNMK